MLRLIEGGHWDKKGYYYSFYLTLPEISNVETVDIKGSTFKSKEISFATKIYLRRSDNYVNIGIRILGFGLGLEINIRSNNGKME